MHRRFLVVIAALALVAGACGGGDDDTKTSTAAKRTTTTAGERSAPTAVAGADDEGATQTTTKTSGSRGGSATTSKSAGGSGGSATAASNPNAAPAPAPVGTYDYAQSGSVRGEPVPPNGTLTVSGGQSQVFRRDFGDNNGSTDILFDFRDDGPFITRVIVRQGVAMISCTFNAPVPAPPWPATAGRTFSGRSTCDNGFTADFNGTVGGRVTDNVGGQSVPAIVINSTLHITGTIFGAAVDITVTDTQHWAPSLRIPTYSHETISGTVSGDVTSTLKSTTPR